MHKSASQVTKTSLIRKLGGWKHTKIAHTPTMHGIIDDLTTTQAGTVHVLDYKIYYHTARRLGCISGILHVTTLRLLLIEIIESYRSSAVPTRINILLNEQFKKNVTRSRMQCTNINLKLKLLKVSISRREKNLIRSVCLSYLNWEVPKHMYKLK